MEMIKRLFRPVVLFNSILICLCVLGFIYQVYLIFNQYMLSKTVVNLEVKRLKNQPLPAITVCIPVSLISISNLPKLDNFNQEFYQDYINLVNQSVIRNPDSEHIIININKTFTEKVKPRLNEVYNKIIRNNYYKIKNFDKLFDLGISHKSISLSLEGNTENLINESFIEFNNNEYYKYKIKETPIYSFSKTAGYSDYGIKCFTYFSALQEYWSEFQFESEEILIKIFNDFKEYGPNKAYLIATHSPNILQKYSKLDYFEVKPGVSYDNIKYSQLGPYSSKLL